MVKNGVITEQEKNDAYQEELNLVGDKGQSNLNTIIIWKDFIQIKNKK